MAPILRTDPIGEADLVEYIDNDSDFAFELQCWHTMTQAGFNCEHGGSYIDPVTRKPRQFDIRLRYLEHHVYRLRCAIECKNLKEHFPLLVLCTPRIESECFHEVILSREAGHGKPPPELPGLISSFGTIRTDVRTSAYQPGEPTGKSCSQVGRKPDTKKDGKVVPGETYATDADVYEKWAQALASAKDLIDESVFEGVRTHMAAIGVVVPILVVPDNTLWRVEFDSTGARKTNPARVDRCPFYVAQEYKVQPERMPEKDVVLSHLEIVTLTGLQTLVMEIVRSKAPSKSWFPRVPVALR